jgi:hypothetical protein
VSGIGMQYITHRLALAVKHRADPKTTPGGGSVTGSLWLPSSFTGVRRTGLRGG